MTQAKSGHSFSVGNGMCPETPPRKSSAGAIAGPGAGSRMGIRAMGARMQQHAKMIACRIRAARPESN